MVTNLTLKNALTGTCGLLVLIWLLATSACTKEAEKPIEFVPIIFVVPLTFAPQGPEIKIGDTLWITANTPDTLLEFYSGLHYPLPDFDFKMVANVFQIGNPNLYLTENIGSIDKFQIINEIGSFDNLRESFGEFHLGYSNNQYQCKIGLIPTHPGVFTFSLLWPIDLNGMPWEQIDLRPALQLTPADNGAKRSPAYEAFFFIINKGNTNLSLLKENCKLGSLENPGALQDVYYEQKCTFTFKVIE